jgi:hypothetical protein
MAQSKPVQTPLGVFTSISQAARAHHCDKSTIQRYMEVDPANFRMLDSLPTPVANPASAGWQHYRSLDHDGRDAWYESWCQAHGFDPDSEQGGNAFFDALDQASIDVPELEDSDAEA